MLNHVNQERHFILIDLECAAPLGHCGFSPLGAQHYDLVHPRLRDPNLHKVYLETLAKETIVSTAQTQTQTQTQTQAIAPILDPSSCEKEANGAIFDLYNVGALVLKCFKQAKKYLDPETSDFCNDLMNEKFKTAAEALKSLAVIAIDHLDSSLKAEIDRVLAAEESRFAFFVLILLLILSIRITSERARGSFEDTTKK